MSAEIRTPTERACQDCGREEYWDDAVANWRVANQHVGNIHCIHAWDITGTFTPIDK